MRQSSYTVRIRCAGLHADDWSDEEFQYPEMTPNRVDSEALDTALQGEARMQLEDDFECLNGLVQRMIPGSLHSLTRFQTDMCAGLVVEQILKASTSPTGSFGQHAFVRTMRGFRLLFAEWIEHQRIIRYRHHLHTCHGLPKPDVSGLGTEADEEYMD